MSEIPVDVVIRPNVDGATVAERALQRVRSAGSGVNDQLQRLTRTSAALAATLATSSALLLTSVSSYARFEQGMRNVGAVAGSTAEELDEVTAAALRMAAATRFNPTQVTDALYSLASAGLNARQQIETLPTVLSFAEAAGADLATSTELLVTTMNQFGVAASASASIADTFVAAIGASPANVERLALGMRNAAPTAVALGHSLVDTTAAVSLLIGSFGNGERAGTGLRAILTELGEKASGLGVEVRDSRGEFLPLLDILRQLEARGVRAADVVAEFGAEAGPALAALLSRGSEALASMQERLVSTGQAAEVAAKQMDTLQGRTDGFLSALQVLQVTLGQQASGGQVEFMERMTGVVNRLTEEVKSSGSIIDSVWGAALGALARGVEIAADNLDILKGVLLAVVAINVYGWLASVLTLLNPLTLAIMGVVAAAGLLGHAIASWGRESAAATAALVDQDSKLRAVATSAREAAGSYDALRIAREQSSVGALAEQAASEVSRLEQERARLEGEVARLREGRTDYAGRRTVDAPEVERQLRLLQETESALQRAKEEAGILRREYQLLGRAAEQPFVAMIRGAQELAQSGNLGQIGEALAVLRGELEQAEARSSMAESLGLDAAEQADMAARIEVLRSTIGSLSEAQERAAVSAGKLTGASADLGRRLEEQIAQQSILLASVDAGVEGEQRAARAVAVRSAAVQASVAVDSAQGRALGELAGRLYDLEQAYTAAKQAVAVRRDLEEQVAVQERLAQGLRGSTAESRFAERAIAQRAAAVRAGLGPDTEAAAAVAELAGALFDLTEANQAARRDQAALESLRLEVSRRQDLVAVAKLEAQGLFASARALQAEAAAREASSEALEGNAAELARLARLREELAQSEREIRSSSALAAEVALLERRAAVYAESAGSAAELEAALRDLSIEEEILRRQTAARVDAESEAGKEIEESVRRMAALEDSINSQSSALANVGRSWGAFASLLEQVGSRIGGTLGNMVGAIGNVITAFQEYQRVANDPNATGGERALAGAQFGIGLAGSAQQLGLAQGNRGTGSFGGQLSGDYSTEFAAIGGAIYGPVGAAIGLVGAAVKRGADEGMAKLELIAGEVAVSLVRNQSGLGTHVQEALRTVGETLTGLVQSAGGYIAGLPDVLFKLRDDLITVTIGRTEGTFAEMEDAISFAIARLARGGDFGGLDEVVAEMFRNTIAKSAEELQRDLQTAFDIRDLQLGEFQVGLRNTLVELIQLREEGIRLGLEIAVVNDEISRVLGRTRDEILGIERDSLRSDILDEIRGYNEERARLIADAERRITELVRRMGLTESAERLQEMVGDLVNGTEEGSWAFEQLTERLTRLGIATGMSSEEIQAQIEELRRFISTIPDAIDPGQIDEIERRRRQQRGGGSGRDLAAEREAFLEQLEQMASASLPEFSRALFDVQQQYAELLERARELGVGEAEVAALRAEAVAQLAEDLRSVVDAALDRRSDLQRQRDELMSYYDDLIAANRELLAAEGERAVAEWRIEAARRAALQALIEDVIGGLGLPMEQTRRGVAELEDSLGFLWQSFHRGEISMERMRDVLDQLEAQSASTLLGLAAGILESMGATQQAAALRARLAEAEFHLQVAQLNFLYTEYQRLGLLVPEVAAIIADALAFINDPANWPDFSVPAVPPPPVGGGGLGSTAPDNRDADMERLLRQLQSWRDEALSSAERQLAALHEQRDEMLALAAELGYSQAEVLSAFEVAMEAFLRDLKSGLRDLLTEITEGASSGLSAGARMDLAQSQVEDLIRRLQANPGDVAAIEQLDSALRQWLEATGEFTGGAGPLYDIVRSQIEAILRWVLGEGAFPGGVFGGTGTRPGLGSGASDRPGGGLSGQRDLMSEMVGLLRSADERLRVLEDVAVVDSEDAARYRRAQAERGARLEGLSSEQASAAREARIAALSQSRRVAS